MTRRILVTALRARMEHLDFDPGRCRNHPRLRLRIPSCRACVDACPKGGNLGDSFRFQPPESCDGCGLCVAACAEEALFLTNDSDIQILGTLQKAGRTSQRLQIACVFAARDETGDCLRLSCLGRVTLLLLSGAVRLGYTDIVLAGGNCEHCPAGRQVWNLGARIALWRELLVLIADEAQITLETTETVVPSQQEEGGDSPKPDASKVEPLARRGLFGLWNAKGKEALGRIGLGLVEQVRHRTGGWDLPRREARNRPMLRRIVRSATQGPLLRKEERHVPFAQVRIDAARCTACGECAALCPVMALELSPLDGDQARLRVDSGLCTRCGACVSVCSAAAVAFASPFDLQKTLSENEPLVLNLSVPRCRVCGAPVLNREHGLCPTHLREAMMNPDADFWKERT